MMKLNWIEFENLETGLKCERVSFNEGTTLLVGVSGSGKTQIIDAIFYSFDYLLRKRYREIFLKPFWCKMCFSIGDNEYTWEYKIDRMNNEYDDIVLADKANLYFVFEQIICNGDIILQRDENGIKLLGYDKVPRFSSNDSLLRQLGEDEQFSKISDEFSSLYPLDLDYSIRTHVSKESFLKFQKAAEKISEEKLGDEFLLAFDGVVIPLMLYVVKKYCKDIFEQILSSIQEVFSEISDIDVDFDDIRNICTIVIEVGDKKIKHYNISNGMLKTIYYLVALYTARPNAVMLIDEFENGLGMNCISTLAEIITSDRPDMQLIISSHHPTIIRDIDASQWKVVERNDSIITIKTTEEIGLPSSLHDQYFHLLNLWGAKNRK